MTGGGHRRARPRGVIGAELWVGVSAPADLSPSDPGELRFLRLGLLPPQIVTPDLLVEADE